MLSLILKCTLAGIAIMILSMVAGEVTVEPKLFGGFISRPALWLPILAEILIYFIPCMILALIILAVARKFHPKRSKQVVVAGWLFVGIAMALAFKEINYPGNWDLSRLWHADVAFGWLIPCSLILLSYVCFSFTYLDQRNRQGL